MKKTASKCKPAFGDVEVPGVFSVEGDGDSCVYIGAGPAAGARIDARAKYAYTVARWGERNVGFRLSRVNAAAGFSRDAVIKGPRGTIKFQAERGRFQFQNKKLRAAPRHPEPVLIISRAGGEVIDISFPPNFCDTRGRLIGTVQSPKPSASVRKSTPPKTRDEKVAEVTALVQELMTKGKLGAREALIRAAVKYGK